MKLLIKSFRDLSCHKRISRFAVLNRYRNIDYGYTLVLAKLRYLILNLC